MGHAAGKDIYRKLGNKIDNLIVKAPWNDTLYKILKELYTAEEAELVVKMPYGISTFERLQKITKINESSLKKNLDRLCKKGLVMDLWMLGGYRYMPSPMVIGIFEFTMMRTGSDIDSKKAAGLFHEYMLGEDSFFKANFENGQIISPMRTLPYEETVSNEDYAEILDYEKAAAIIENGKIFSIGICSCRHEKLHVGKKECNVPLETCSAVNSPAKYLIRNGLAKEVSKTEMLENLNRSREMGLVLSTDNQKRKPGFICNCCGCCCNLLLGIKKYGYPNILISSTYIAEISTEECTECEDCVEVCPVNSIKSNKNGAPEINNSVCLGCGVCALKCSTGALRLVKRETRVFHPENTFERVILQALERGTLQNLIFDNPQSISHSFMRGVIGGFFRLSPIKRSLMSETLRSRFFSVIKKAV